MPKKPKEYKRLRGSKRGFIRYNTLWLGQDHLLSLHSNRFTEDYKRFYFQDIQAITTRKTARGWIMNLTLGLFAGLFSMLALQFDRGASTFFWIVTGLFLLLLLINWFLGPSCVCHLRTAVQTEKLPSLNRLRTARKALGLFRPRIERAQTGALTPEALREKALEISETKGTRPLAASTRRVPFGDYGGWAHKMLFSFLLCDGLFTFTTLFYDHLLVSLSTSALSTAVGACVVIALIKQHGSNIKDSIKRLTWITLGYFCFSCLVGYILFIIISFKTAIKKAGGAINNFEVIKMLFTMSPLENPYMLGIYIFYICCSFGLGISGFLLMRAPRWVRGVSSASQTPLTNPNAQPTGLDRAGSRPPAVL